MLMLKTSEQCQDIEQVTHWLQEYKKNLEYVHEEISFSDSDQWYWDGAGCALRHKTGKFYSIAGFSKGLEKRPMIDQPEVGTQGFVIYKEAGEVYILAQARTEPGNLNIVELGPSIQATWSNYSRAHKGRKTIFLDLFHDENAPNRMADCVLPELGTYFFRKYNRNVIVEVKDPAGFESERFKWISLTTMSQLFDVDHVINNDARLVYGLLMAKLHEAQQSETDADVAACQEMLETLRDRQSSWNDDVERVDLKSLDDWQITEDKIKPKEEGDYEVLQLRVNASDREVCQWDQPLVHTLHKGLVALILRKVQGQWQMMLEYKEELGNEFGYLMGPSATIANPDTLSTNAELSSLFSQPDKEILATHSCSEEGGRFFECTNEYQLIDVSNVDAEIIEGVMKQNRCWLNLESAITLFDRPNVLSDDCRGVIAIFMAYQKRTSV
jgi:oxidase EvaA